MTNRHWRPQSTFIDRTIRFYFRFLPTDFDRSHGPFLSPAGTSTDEVGITNGPVPVRQKHEYIFVCILISVYASPDYHGDGHGRTQFIIFVSGDTGRLMSLYPYCKAEELIALKRVGRICGKRTKKKSPQVYGKITVSSCSVLALLYRNDRRLTDKHRNPRAVAVKK